MKTKRILHPLALLTLIFALCGAACSVPTAPTANRPPGEPIVICPSPYLNDPLREVIERTLFDRLPQLPAGQEVTIVNGFDGTKVCSMTMPALKHDSAEARKIALQPVLKEMFAFFAPTNPAAAGALTNSGALDVPRVLKQYAQQSGQGRRSFIFIGGPWRKDANAALDMAAGRVIPNDDHLLTSSTQSPFGVGDYKDRFRGDAVMICTPDAQVATPQEHAGLQLFYRKLAHAMGAKLLRYGSSDLAEAIEFALAPKGDELPGGEPQSTGTLAMVSPAAGPFNTAPVQVASVAPASTPATVLVAIPVSALSQQTEATTPIQSVAVAKPIGAVTVASATKVTPRPAATTGPKPSQPVQVVTAHLPEVTPAFQPTTQLPVKNPSREKAYVGIRWTSPAGSEPIDLDLHVAREPGGKFLNYNCSKTEFGIHHRDLLAEDGAECEYVELDGSLDLSKACFYVNHYKGQANGIISGVVIVIAKNGQERIGAFGFPAGKGNVGQNAPSAGEPPTSPAWRKLDLGKILRDGEVSIRTAAR